VAVVVVVTVVVAAVIATTIAMNASRAGKFLATDYTDKIRIFICVIRGFIVCAPLA
jgi:hypothetical protein